MPLPIACRVAIVLWAALLIGVAGRIVVSKPTSQTVVPIYLAAGERWLDGRDLYAADSGLDVYRNPPGFAAGFAVFTHWPPKVAGLVWRGFGAAAFLLGLWRFRRDVVPDLSTTRTGVMFAVAAVLALPSINNGQVNTLIAAAVLHGIAASSRQNWWYAAFWFTLGGWLKLYPFAAGCLVGVAYPRPIAPRLVAISVIAFAVPFILHDPGYVAEQHRHFVGHLRSDDRTFTTPDRVPRDWTIVPRAWLGVIPLPHATKAVSLLAAAAAAVCVWFRVRRGVREIGPLVLVLGSAWMTVFGPATESNTYSLVAGAAGYAVAVARSRGAVVLAWVGFGLLAAPVLRAMFPNDWTFHALGPQAVGTLLVTTAALWEMLARRRNPA